MKTHWKRLTNPDYLGAYSLQPNEIKVIKIKKVENRLVPDSTGTKQDCIVAELYNEKPMILNKTNCKTISNVLKSPAIEDWKDKQIQIKIVKVKAFGELVDALRVVNKLPELPELNPKHEAWEKAKAALSAGDVTLEQIKSKYKITKENQDAITSK